MTAKRKTVTDRHGRKVVITARKPGSYNSWGASYLVDGHWMRTYVEGSHSDPDAAIAAAVDRLTNGPEDRP
jgi:hypothetical protein